MSFDAVNLKSTRQKLQLVVLLVFVNDQDPTIASDFITFKSLFGKLFELLDLIIDVVQN